MTGTCFFNGVGNVMNSGVGSSEIDPLGRREVGSTRPRIESGKTAANGSIKPSNLRKKKRTKNQKQKQNLKRQLKLAE